MSVMLLSHLSLMLHFTLSNFAFDVAVKQKRLLNPNPISSITLLDTINFTDGATVQFCVKCIPFYSLYRLICNFVYGVPRYKMRQSRRKVNCFA